MSEHLDEKIRIVLEKELPGLNSENVQVTLQACREMEKSTNAVSEIRRLSSLLDEKRTIKFTLS